MSKLDISPPNGFGVYETPSIMTEGPLDIDSPFDDRREYLGFLRDIAGYTMAYKLASNLADFINYETESQYSRRDFVKYSVASTTAAAIVGMPETAQAQTPNGYICATCNPIPSSNFSKYVFVYWRESNPAETFGVDIPKDLLPFNIKGLIPGRIYHARLMAVYGTESDGPLSPNEIVFVPRLPGNCEISKIPATLNRVDNYDKARFFKALGKRRGQKKFDPHCDFDCDGIVSNQDLLMINGYYGSVQFNDLQTLRTPPVDSLSDTTIVHS